MVSRRLRTLALRFAVGAWFVGMLALGAGLLARHLVALPAPAQNQKLAASLSALRSIDGHGHWLAVHVLYAECSCSQRIVAHLLATGRPSDWEEIVLWAGKAPPDAALLARFEVRQLTSAELARLGIEAAPSLVVLDKEDRVRYSGGYTDRKQGPVIDDLRILAEAQRSRSVTALPILGCAVSDKLKKLLSRLPSP